MFFGVVKKIESSGIYSTKILCNFQRRTSEISSYAIVTWVRGVMQVAFRKTNIS
jgi:hypothetical protein